MKEMKRNSNETEVFVYLVGDLFDLCQNSVASAVQTTRYSPLLSPMGTRKPPTATGATFVYLQHEVSQCYLINANEIVRYCPRFHVHTVAFTLGYASVCLLR